MHDPSVHSSRNQFDSPPTDGRRLLTMDLALILVAFIFGFAANTIKAAPVGRLSGSPVLFSMPLGIDATDAVDLIADVRSVAPAVWYRPQTATHHVWAGQRCGLEQAFTLRLPRLSSRGLLLGLGALGLPLAAGLSLQQARRGRICLLVLKHRVCSEGARGTQRGHVIAGQTRGRHSGCSGHLRCRLSDSDRRDATVDLGDSLSSSGSLAAKPVYTAGSWTGLAMASSCSCSA